MGEHADDAIDRIIFPDYEKLGRSLYRTDAQIAKLVEARYQQSRNHKQEEAQKMNDYTQTNEVDTVTLIQLQAGAKLVEALFAGANGFGGKRYTFKTTEFLTNEELCVVLGTNGYNVVKIVNTKDVEFKHGITYHWIVDRVQQYKIDAVKDLDKKLRNQLALGKAMQDAKALAQSAGISVAGYSVLPQVGYTPAVSAPKPAANPVNSTNSDNGDDDDMPF